MYICQKKENKTVKVRMNKWKQFSRTHLTIAAINEGYPKFISTIIEVLRVAGWCGSHVMRGRDEV